jgi:shikimate kinase
MLQQNVFLVGPMGVGKTTIGRLLAEELGYSFVDSDREIEARCGADIPWIFDVEGEEGFRERESKVLDDLSRKQGIVLATGGGIVLNPDNRKKLQSRGFVVYLTAQLDLLAERTGKDKKRPLLQVDNPRQILEKTLLVRDPLYREIASAIVSTDQQNPRQAAKEIAALVRRQIAS